jgi:hypothetical protein
VIARSRALATLIALTIVALPALGSAQTSGAPPRPARFMVSGGLTLNGSYDLGDRNAELRGNSGSSSAPFTLFSADAAMHRGAGIEARFGYAISRSISVEVGGTRSTPNVGVTIGQDAESSGTTEMAESVSQYSVDVGGVVKLWSGQTRRLQPYAVGGVGYLRQLHEDRLLVETGHTFFGGGGVQYAWRSSARRPAGIRAEAKLVRRAGGIDFEDKSRSHPSISVLGFLAF